MGVPKFYRWISERYPCLSEIVKEHQISEFDNLYLDMNGIVHVVSHPDDSNPHFRITEEKIFRDIFHYIEVLFRLIKPRKVFFMAIDGVAPRAKMNQQRGRRFRSAREAEELIAKAIKKGETLPSEDRFDSNCITPGTPFMVKLQEQLKYFIADKVTNNELWQGPRIYLSGHDTPGEGEHKVMDFIRSERCNPDHDPNTRHCLYGLDADLLMLGLTSHEPHFSLLREEVRFGGKESQKRSTTPEDTTFHLLHLSLLREYIDFEFGTLKLHNKMTFAYDLERIIDDWILMGFLVGNDFIPHLPNLHIHQDGLPLLWGVYMKVLPNLDGYINEDGKINLARFEVFMEELAKFDFEQYSDTYADLKWFAGKTGNDSTTKQKGKKSEAFPVRKNYMMRKAENMYKQANAFELLEGYDEEGKPIDYSDVLGEEDMELGEESESAAGASTDAEALMNGEALSMDSQDSLMMAEFKHHKRAYYMEKLHVECVTLDFLQEQALQYVRALQWILYYYYDGCQSWSWFFPFHYAPFISDVRNFSQVEIVFERSRPFLPFQQLMAVLPAGSRKLIPDAYKPLMTEESSPIHDFYPVQFESDLNGKQQEWEAVVLIPFIEENRLLEAMHSRESDLTADEVSRNVHGASRLYQFSNTPQTPYPSSMPGVFPDIHNNYARVTELDMWEFEIPRHKLKRGLFAGVLMDVHFPGFPTFKHVPHKAKLKKANVKVFQAMSRGENMLVSINPSSEPADLESTAERLLGKTVFIRWPHLAEARVESVCNAEFKISIARGKNSKKSENETDETAMAEWQRAPLNDMERNKFYLDREGLQEIHHSRRGITLGQVEILVYVNTLLGRRYLCGSHGNITLDKQYSHQQEYHAVQAVVTDLLSHNPDFKQFTTIEELFPTDSCVFMLGNPQYACQGKVLNVADKGRIRIEFTVLQEPDFSDIQYKLKSLGLNYTPAWLVAQKLSISSHMVSKITGSYRISTGNEHSTLNIGLNLKSNARGEEVPGFTKKHNDQWLYSSKIITTLDDYMKTFPRVFEVIQQKDESEITPEELFAEGSGQTMETLQKYLKELECSRTPRVRHGCHLVDEPVIALLEPIIDGVNAENRKKRKGVTMQVRPHLLYKPLAGSSVLADASSTYQLFDRVVNVRVGFSVPLGLRGTIIGIYPAERELDSMYEVLFDEEFVDALSIRLSTRRAYRVNGIALANQSHGLRKSRPAPVQTTTVTTPTTSNHNRNNKNSNYDNRQRKDNGGNNGNSWRKPPEKQTEFNDIWQDLKQPGNGSPRKSDPKSARPEMDYSYSARLRNDQSGSSWRNDRTNDNRPVTDSTSVSKMTILGRPSNKKSNGNNSQSRQRTLQHDSSAYSDLIGSLDMAAAVLPSVRKSSHNLSTDSRVDNIPTVEKTLVVNTQIDDVKSEKAQISPRAMKPAAPQTDNDFAALMNSLKILDSKQDTKDNVNSGQFGLQTQHSLTVLDVGRKISVEELFQVAKSEEVPLINNKQSEPEFPVKKGACEELSDWLKSQNLPPAVYDYTAQPNGGNVSVSWLGSVFLGNQLRFQGSASKTKAKAGESAAAVALNHLRWQKQRQSAFQPVQPVQRGLAYSMSGHPVVHPMMGLPLQQGAPRQAPHLQSHQGPHQTPQQGLQQLPAAFMGYPWNALIQQQQLGQGVAPLFAASSPNQHPGGMAAHPGAQMPQHSTHAAPHPAASHPSNQPGSYPRMVALMTGAQGVPLQAAPAPHNLANSPTTPAFYQTAATANQSGFPFNPSTQSGSQKNLQKQRPAQAVYQPPQARQSRPTETQLSNHERSPVFSNDLIGPALAQAPQHNPQAVAQFLQALGVTNTVDTASTSSTSRNQSESLQPRPQEGGGQSEEVTPRKRTDSTSGNPFVPLQVSRREKTPQKKSAEPDNLNKPSNGSFNNDVITDVTNVKSDVKTSNQDSAPSRQNLDKSKKTRKPKARRLAANFSAT